ncbi:MAG: hypothetical protein LAT68_07815 [Cyclobacteriaceae bacterium]|nr:hypothetical protein [Cyclobacteriaceae bacterium]MCH8516219.1 hypothetical protein [Cyclobacteriaceae bacterium]
MIIKLPIRATAFVFILKAFLLLSVSAIAQEQAQPKKKIITDENGRIIANADIGLYFFMSDKDDGTDLIKMISKKHEKHVNPMQIDGDGIHFLKHDDLDLGFEVEFEFYADGIAPNSTLSFDKGRISVKGGIHYYPKDVKLSIESRDNMSGVEKIYYSLNGANYQEYGPSIQLKEEGSYELKYYATDKVGNVEEAKSIKIIVDGTAPTTSLEVSGDQYEQVLSPRSGLILTATDEVTGVDKITYQFGNNPFRNYSNEIKLSGLAQGNYRFSYQAQDVAGNQSELATFEFYLDNTPPILTTDILGDQFQAQGRSFTSGRSKIKLMAIDNKAGVKEIMYSINEGEFQKYEAPFYVPRRTGDGMLKVQAYAVDNVNNRSRTESLISGDRLNNTTLDLVGPDISIRYSGKQIRKQDTLFISPNTQVVLAASDRESGVKEIVYKLSDEDEKKYSKPFASTNKGLNLLSVTAFDNVENTNVKDDFFFLDNEGPEIEVTYSVSPNAGTEATYSSRLKLYLAASDEHVGTESISYAINGGQKQSYRGEISGFRNGSEIEVEVFAVDFLGNESRKTIGFKIKD